MVILRRNNIMWKALQLYKHSTIPITEKLAGFDLRRNMASLNDATLSLCPVMFTEFEHKLDKEIKQLAPFREKFLSDKEITIVSRNTRNGITWNLKTYEIEATS
ncbi:hypothetical protein WA026_014896 [Henosepilachna vigintioctopunctata]|uniref:Uncharacterized protein n=1 Tax=Henosepilachna vigintioctopunctata TaxID=420089 RepID=A0AAW1UYD4_9CUCU